MDTETARYLLSAIIQAVAISWALIMAMGTILFTVVLRLFEGGGKVRIPSELDNVKKKEWIDQKIKETDTGKSIFMPWEILMLNLNLSALATVIIAILTLSQFSENWHPYWAVVVTVGLACYTFGSMAFFVGFLVSEFRGGGESHKKDKLDYLKEQRRILENR